MLHVISKLATLFFLYGGMAKDQEDVFQLSIKYYVKWIKGFNRRMEQKVEVLKITNTRFDY